MPKLPLNISKLTETWKEAAATTGESAGVVLAGDTRLVGLAQQQFFAGGTLPAVWARPLAELGQISTVPGELVLLMLTAEAEAEALATLGAGVPKGGVVMAVDEGTAASGEVTYPLQGCARVSFGDNPRGWRAVFEACVERSSEHAVALGRRYEVLRSAAARKVVHRAAGQNALVGLVFFVPGADMPVMTLNQIKMVLSVASIYGEEIGKDRILELLGVVGLGLGMRGLARSLVGSTPGIGLVIRASMGYTGTVALGLAAMRYFKEGAPASTSRVLALAQALRR